MKFEWISATCTFQVLLFFISTINSTFFLFKRTQVQEYRKHIAVSNPYNIENSQYTTKVKINKFIYYVDKENYTPSY